MVGKSAIMEVLAPPPLTPWEKVCAKVDPLAKAVELKPEEISVRSYADRLILEQLTEMHTVVKLSDLVDRLQSAGLGLAAVRSLLASNQDRFAYSERRWVPAARVLGEDRPAHEAVRLFVESFGGPVSKDLVMKEVCFARAEDEDSVRDRLDRYAKSDSSMFLTDDNKFALTHWVFVASDEKVERALGLNMVSEEEVAEGQKALGDFDWTQEGAIEKALAKLAPVKATLIGALAWLALNPQSAHAVHRYRWREFNAKLLATPGYVFSGDGMIAPESAVKGWIASAIKIADRIAPTVEIEDAAPIEMKSDDVKKIVARIVASEESVTATKLLEDFYEITPSVKTFPDDYQNLIDCLRAESEVVWVGGDRFRKAGTLPDFIDAIPEVFEYEETQFTDEEGELIDVELSDDGLSTTLRKLLFHPLSTDVLDEDVQPAPKQLQDSIRLVLKPIHRELGTFPLCQVPTGWLSAEPKLQEIVLQDSNGRELQAWANLEARLIFNLIDWFYEQPVESGAVFSLTKTNKPNVFEFDWLDQTDPVVFITTQRMEELREIAAGAENLSTLDVLRKVMEHWPKGADFLTVLWEVNVIRRSSRRLVASLLSSYACFYQRSGSPVWHYDSKKNEQGFDKTKKKFIIKR